jgi:hypothetical protein
MSTTTTSYLVSTLTAYYAPVGTAQVADTVAYGAAWPAAWVKLGTQKEGAKLSYSYDLFKIATQQSKGSAIGYRRFNEQAMMEMTLAEFTHTNLILALSGKSVLSTAPGASNGIEVVGVGGQQCLPQYIWGFEGEMIDDECQESFFVRIFFHKGLVDSGFESNFQFDDYAGVPLKINAVFDLSKPSNEQLMHIRREIPQAAD